MARPGCGSQLARHTASASFLLHEEAAGKVSVRPMAEARGHGREKPNGTTGRGVRAALASTSRAVMSGMKEWRLPHPKATFREFEAAVDEKLSGMRLRLLEDLALGRTCTWASWPTCRATTQRRGQRTTRRCAFPSGWAIERRSGGRWRVFRCSRRRKVKPSARCNWVAPRLPCRSSLARGFRSVRRL
jgi:hypothetical protein